MALDTAFIAHAFSPLRYIDIQATYHAYSQVIDFFIYLLIFIGLAMFVFEQRFPGRAGKFLIVGIGTALAISLSVTEQRLGFNLQSFGPVAGIMVLFLVGLILFNLIHRQNVGTINSAVIVLLMVYIGMGAFMPSFLDWVDQNIPLLHLVVAMALAFAMIRLLLHFLGKVKGARYETEEHEEGQPREDERLVHERGYIKKLGKSMKRDVGYSKDVIADLRDVFRHVDRYSADPAAKQAITRKLVDARDKELLIAQRLEYINMLNDKLETFDIRLFTDLKSRYGAMSGEEQDRLRKEIQREHKKVHDEMNIKKLTADSSRMCQDFDTALRESARFISTGQTHLARQSLTAAMQKEKDIQNMLITLKHYELKLFRLTKKEIRDIER